MSEMFHNWWLAHQFEFVLSGILLLLIAVAMALFALAEWWTKER